MISHLLTSLHTIIVIFLYCQLKVATATVIDKPVMYVAQNKYMKLSIIGTLLELYSKLVLP